MKEPNNSISSRIINYLETSKNRAIVLCPPLLLYIVGLVVASTHAYTNFGFIINPIAQYTFIGGALWLLLSLWVVLWSDYKRNMNKYDE